MEPLGGLGRLCFFIVGLPLFAFLIISFATRRRGEVSAAVAIASLMSACLLSGAMAWERLSTGVSGAQEWQRVWLGVGEPLAFSIDMGVLVDNLSVFTSLMVTFVASLVAIYSSGYMSKEIGHFPTQNTESLSRFFGYLCLFVFSMLGLVFSNNLLQTFIFWELVGVCSYFLIGFWYFKKSAADANKKSFVVTKFADLFFLIGMLALGIGANTFRFTELDTLTTLPLLLGSAALPLICIAFGPIGKSAQFPLHVWLPDAMEGPTPVSALIHAATMVAAGIYLVGRLFPLYQLSFGAAYFVTVVGALTALMAALIALVQNDIKRVLAYSTISQLGFMLTALGAGAYTAGLFHLFTHAFFKALLFLGSGAVIVACHSNDIWRMGGLKKHLPKTHFAFAMGCLALAGFPGFSGFFSKDEILGGVAHSHNYAALVLLSAAAFLTAFYVTRMYCIAFLGEYRGEQEPSRFAGLVPSPDLPAPISPSSWALGMTPEWTEEQADPEVDPPACLGAKQEHVPHHEGPPHEVPVAMYGPLLVLAFFAVFLGFAGLPGEHNQFHHLINHPSEEPHGLSIAVMLGSIVIALGGIGLGWSLFGKDPEKGEEKLRAALGKYHETLCQKFYLDHFWAWLVSTTMMMGARFAAWVDDEIIDGLVRGSGFATGSLAEKMRKEHSGQISHYLFMLVVSLILLTALLASIQPDFALSPEHLFRPQLPDSGGGLFR